MNPEDDFKGLDDTQIRLLHVEARQIEIEAEARALQEIVVPALEKLGFLANGKPLRESIEKRFDELVRESLERRSDHDISRTSKISRILERMKQARGD